MATFARIARNYAYDMHAKEKEVREKYESLKRKYEPDDEERDGEILCPRSFSFIFIVLHKAVAAATNVPIL